jgi:hypothetical protein
MKNMLVSLCSAALLVSGISVVHVLAADTKTVEGELVDSHCYAKSGAKGEGHAKCGSKCAASGIPVAVLADGKAWTLATNPKPLSEAVGKTVRVTGTQNAEAQTIAVDKVEVKDGDAWKELKLNDVHHKGEKKEE